MFQRIILPRLAWLFYRALSLTWRVQIIEDPQLAEYRLKQTPIVLAHWHGDSIVFIYPPLVSSLHAATMTSTSRDGQIIDYLIYKAGGVTSKGSSTRKAVQALKGLIRLGRKGHPVFITVDGPKGPIYQVKSGVFKLSQSLNAPIFPAGTFCKRRWLFSKSWDKTCLPHPFAKMVILFDTPMPPVPKEVDPRSPKLARELCQAINNATQRASKAFADNKS